MKYSNIANTNIKVSKICLGTMTFGEQNTEAEGHQQLNYAFDQGVNFVDTAEMYSVPARKETQGNSEKIVGSWLKTKQRDAVIVATKVTGPSDYFSYVRENLGFSKPSVLDAINNSLKRLQTDYIDIYQLHWPDRNVNIFGQRNYKHNANEAWKDNIKEVIETLNDLVKEGKIRHYGVSNETSWGLMKHLSESEKNNFAQCKTIQNPYSLLNRHFEINLAEVAMRENVGLMAYSPLAFGVLSGKYLDGNLPEDSRIKLFPQYNRYNSESCNYLTKQYAVLAAELNISLAQLALAFVNQQPFVIGNVIGATKMSQLKENISSINIDLSDETLSRIDAIQESRPNPAS